MAEGQGATGRVRKELRNQRKASLDSGWLLSFARHLNTCYVGFAGGLSFLYPQNKEWQYPPYGWTQIK